MEWLRGGSRWIGLGLILCLMASLPGGNYLVGSELVVSVPVSVFPAWILVWMFPVWLLRAGLSPGVLPMDEKFRGVRFHFRFRAWLQTVSMFPVWKFPAWMFQVCWFRVGLLPAFPNYQMMEVFCLHLVLLDFF
jgi:hypothetical protein